MDDDFQDTGLPSLYSLILNSQPQQTFIYQSPVIDARVYKDVSLTLDGYTFSNCVFINCYLTTTTGDFRIKDCHLQGCTIYFNGNALRVVKMSSILMGNWQHLNEALRASKERDGGITVE